MHRTATLVLVLLALSAATGNAEPVIYEGFSNYVPGSSVIGQQGGTGFSGDWNGRRNLLNSGTALPASPAVSVLASSLSYSDGTNQLVTTGGSLFVSGVNGTVELARAVDQSIIPSQAPGATAYFSFLGRRSGAAADPNDPVYGGAYPWGSNLYPRAAGVDLFGREDNGDAVHLAVGNPSNVVNSDVWRLRGQDLDGVNKDPKSTVPFGAGNNTALVVFRIDYGMGDGGAPRMNMWVNPMLAAEALNGTPVVADWESRDDPLPMQPGWIGVQAGNASSNRPFAEFTFDEFRVGTTWADVTPFTAVPEPTAAGAVLLTGGLALARRRRRRPAPR
jgi:hypothetical protein